MAVIGQIGFVSSNAVDHGRPGKVALCPQHGQGEASHQPSENRSLIRPALPRFALSIDQPEQRTSSGWRAMARNAYNGQVPAIRLGLFAKGFAMAGLA